MVNTIRGFESRLLLMKTLLIIAESKYHGDLKAGLARAGVAFLGFDKKTPTKAEIEWLVAKSDMVIMRNRNVAHHSVEFAKAAAKALNKPFWISQNFGLETILGKLSESFPEEDFSLPAQSVKVKKVPKVRSPKAKLSEAENLKLPKQKSLSQINQALKNVKIEEDDIDFSKIFKK